jgi:hypothetical protein
VAWCDPALVADPAVALEKALGPLAWCRVAEPPVPPEPDPRPPDPPEPVSGLPPELVFQREVLEPPLVGVWVVQGPGLLAIRIGEQSSGEVMWLADPPQPAVAGSPFDMRTNAQGYGAMARPIGIGADARFQAPGGTA